MGLPDCFPKVGQGRRPICVPCLLEREDRIEPGNYLSRAKIWASAWTRPRSGLSAVLDQSMTLGAGRHAKWPSHEATTWLRGNVTCAERCQGPAGTALRCNRPGL